MNKQLDSITLHRFRGIRDMTLPDLGQINLLIGANNSGKTSVLEALATYCQPLDALAWMRVARRRDIIDDAGQSHLSALKWLFPQSISEDPDASYQGEIRISGIGRFPVRVAEAKFVEIEGLRAAQHREGQILRPGKSLQVRRRGASVSLLATWTKGGGEVGVEQESVVSQFWEYESYSRSRKKIRPSLPVAMITPFAHRAEALQIQQLTEATVEGFKDSVLDLLRQFDQQIEGLEILAPEGTRSSLFVRHSMLGMAPLTAFGDGVRRALMYALTLPSVNNGVILIDELETAIHVSALRRVFGWLVKACMHYDVQLFATTHSLEALDAVLSACESDLDRVAAYRLGESQHAGPAKRFSGDMLHQLRYERGLDVR